jgi:hypothetical protein
VLPPNPRACSGLSSQTYSGTSAALVGGAAPKPPRLQRAVKSNLQRTAATLWLGALPQNPRACSGLSNQACRDALVMGLAPRTCSKLSKSLVGSQDCGCHASRTWPLEQARCRSSSSPRNTQRNAARPPHASRSQTCCTTQMPRHQSVAHLDASSRGRARSQPWSPSQTGVSCCRALDVSVIRRALDYSSAAGR